MSLARLKQYFYNPSCLCCGSFLVEDHLFCRACFNSRIAPEMAIKKQFIRNELEYFYLLEWVPGKSDLLSEMVYRMKSDRCVRAWEFYATSISGSIKNLNIEISEIVPIPGSKATSTHALMFAKALSKNLNVPVVEMLEKTSTNGAPGGQQKQRTKAERNTKQDIRRREQITASSENFAFKLKTRLVVDDIVTTGSTFRQAIRALNSNQRVMLLSLFSRTQIG